MFHRRRNWKCLVVVVVVILVAAAAAAAAVVVVVMLSCWEVFHVVFQLALVVANHIIQQNPCLATNQKVPVIDTRLADYMPFFRHHAVSGCKAVVDWLAQSEAGLLQPTQEASELAVGESQELPVRRCVVFGLLQKDGQPRNTLVVCRQRLGQILSNNANRKTEMIIIIIITDRFYQNPSILK